MNATLRNALIAFAVIFAISVGFGFLGVVVHQPVISSDGTILAVIVGLMAFFVLQLRAGNRRSTLADPAAVARALEFKCPPGQSLLYFVRTGFMGRAVGIDILVDGSAVAQLKSKRFTCVELSPGEHQILGQVAHGKSSLLPAPRQMPVTLTPGAVTVLHVAFERTLGTAKIVFQSWSLDATKPAISKSRMVVPYQ